MTWLTNWNYRKSVTISNTGSVLTDYQVLTIIDTATLISAGKILPDCRDIRFTSSDGSTILNYWIESGQNTVSTNIWIKSTLANGDNTVYMYYGNANATSTSNGVNTFPIFDHFEGSSLDSKWVQSIDSGSESVSNSIFYMNAGTNLWSVWRTANAPKIPVPVAFECYGKIAEGGGWASAYFGLSNILDNNWGSDIAFIGRDDPNTKCYGSSNEGIVSEEIRTTDMSSYSKIKIIVRSGAIDYYQNGSLTYTKTTNVPDENMGVYMGCAQPNGQIWMDYLFIRSYVAPEPTLSTIGTEETPANITATSMTITQSETPCRVGICTVSVNVTWTNTGGSSGDFIPNITIDGIPYSSPYSLESLGPGLSVTKTFVISGLTVGTRSICPYPN